MSAQAMAWAWQQREISPEAKLLLVVLANGGVDEYGTTVSYWDSAMEVTGLDGPDFAAAMTELEEADLVVEVDEGDRDRLIFAPKAEDRAAHFVNMESGYASVEAASLARAGSAR